VGDAPIDAGWLDAGRLDAGLVDAGPLGPGQVDSAPLEATIRLRGPFDLGMTVGQIQRGPRDPSARASGTEAWWSWRGTAGSTTLHLWAGKGELRARAWGPGAPGALDGLPTRLGLAPEPGEDELLADPGLVGQLQRRLAGLRMVRTGAVFDALVPTVLEQKVPTPEALAAYRSLALALGAPAPGPGLTRLPILPADLAGMAYYQLHQHGIERRSADTLIGAARRAARLEALVAEAPERARALLMTLPGVGPWTAAEVVRRSHGDGDSLAVGDYHHPKTVCWFLAGERGGTDQRMLELLEPYRPHRMRLVVMLGLAGLQVPRRGPKMQLRRITNI
jgi:hypothetical protein